MALSPILRTSLPQYSPSRDRPKSIARQSHRSARLTLLHLKPRTRQKSQYPAEQHQHARKINQRAPARYRRKILRRQPVADCARHQQKRPLSHYGGEQHAHAQQRPPFRLVQRRRRTRAIEHPEWQQIQKVEHRSKPPQPRPNRLSRLPPKHQASQRRQPSRQRPRQAHCRSRPRTHPQRFPLHIRPKARQKHRHLRRQPAPPDVYVMSHLMNQNQHRNPCSEPPSPQRKVKREKRREAEKEFEFQQREQPFRLRQHDRNRRERPQLFRPLVSVFRNRRHLLRELQPVKMRSHPLRLRGFIRQQRQGFLPGLSRRCKVLRRLGGLRPRGKNRQLLGMHQRVALRARQSPGREVVPARPAFFGRSF